VRPRLSRGSRKLGALSVEPTGQSQEDTRIKSFTVFPPEKQMWVRLEEALLPVTLIAGILFATIGINRSLWLDEANSVLIASHNFTGIMEQLRNDNNLPAYYVLLSTWMHWFGISEVALRLLSGLFYLAGGVVAYLLGRTVFQDGRVAQYSAFFYLISGQVIRQSQNIRMYAMLGLLAATSTLLFFRAVASRTKRDWAVYALVTCLGTLTHVWFFFVVLAHLTCHLMLPRTLRYKLILASLLSLAPFFVLWLPRFLAQLQNGSTAWMPKFQFLFVWNVFAEFYGGESLGLLFYGLCAALILRGAFTHKRLRNPSRSVLLLVCLLTVSIAVPLFVTIFKPIYWPGRYTIIALPPLALLLGRALAEFAPRPLLVCFCYTMILATISARIATRERIPELETPVGYSDRYTTQYILQHSRPGDVLVFTSLSRAAIDYYLLRNKAAGRFQEMNFPAEIANHLGWRDPWAMLNDPSRLAMEAAGIARDLEALLVDARTRIWLFWGWDQEVDEVLRRELGGHFTVEQELDLRGSYYQQVLILEKGASPQQGVPWRD
jgi:uncharacterized membrane protein